MLRKHIDFRELLERVLPVDRLPAVERRKVERALASGVVGSIEQVALAALARLATDGVLRRLPEPGNGSASVRRYQPPEGLVIITIELPPPVERDGVLAYARVSLPSNAEAAVEHVRRLVRLDDPAFLDDLRSRDTRIAQLQQLDQAGRELLRATSVRFFPVEPSGGPAPVEPPIDPALHAQALAQPHHVFYCPDTVNSARLAAEALRLGVPSLALCAVTSGEGVPLGTLEVRAVGLPRYGPEDLARVALLADAFGAVLDRASRIEKLVFMDAATGSFNRSYFEIEAQNEMARAQRDGESLALCIADVDDFKAFNSMFGYEAGNQVLLHVAQALRRGVRPFDTVARWGGEEFAVLLTAPVHADDVLAICERLRNAVQRIPVEIEGLDRRRHGTRVTVSLGVARFPEHGETVQDLWRAANHALLEAKRDGKNRVVLYRA
jgi:diguanylate cyclase (GGDEF)-like protein